MVDHERIKRRLRAKTDHRDLESRIGRDEIKENIKRNRRGRSFPVEDSLIYRLKEEYKQRDSIKVSAINDGYRLSLNDSTVQNPFVISPEIANTIRDVTKGLYTPEDISFRIFSWMQDNVTYGDGKRKKRGVGYKSSEEVKADKEGICGEMAYLYITMARCCGLTSAYVYVDKDFRGKKVNHACAAVELSERGILVDPAYNAYDIDHLSVKIMSDIEVLRNYNAWRGSA